MNQNKLLNMKVTIVPIITDVLETVSKILTNWLNELKISSFFKTFNKISIRIHSALGGGENFSAVLIYGVIFKNVNTLKGLLLS